MSAAVNNYAVCALYLKQVDKSVSRLEGSDRTRPHQAHHRPCGFQPVHAVRPVVYAGVQQIRRRCCRESRPMPTYTNLY